nr:protein multipolar spindle 1 isoform X1 [Tanacetum cinerariifolium]
MTLIHRLEEEAKNLQIHLKIDVRIAHKYLYCRHHKPNHHRPLPYHHLLVSVCLGVISLVSGFRCAWWFLTQVRLKERRKRRSEGSARWLYFSENNDEVTEQLRASVDFLPDDANFTNWSHQVVDFILEKVQSGKFPETRSKHARPEVDVQEVEATALAGRDRYIEGYEVEGHQKHLKLVEGYVEVGRLLTLYQACIHDFMFYGHSLIVFCLPYPEDSIKNITSHEKITNSVEGIIGSLSLLLVRKMCPTLQGDGAGQVHTNTQFHVQHLLRKLEIISLLHVSVTFLDVYGNIYLIWLEEVGLFGDLFEEIEVAANALTSGYNNVTNNMTAMATSTSPLQSKPGRKKCSIN